MVRPTVLTESKPAANINDHIPMVNILPFGMCQSLANPMVAAATAAALGVLTPMPCIPVTPAPWVPGSPTDLVAGHAGPEQHQQVHVHLGGRYPDYESRHDERDDPLRNYPIKRTRGTANKANCNSTFRPRVCTMTDGCPESGRDWQSANP